MASSVFSEPEPQSPGSVPALDRSLDILELLARWPRGLTLSELSAELAVPKNAVFRITQTLLARGYLARDDELRFSLTRKWLALGLPRAGGRSLTEAAREPMRGLRDATRETVQLGVLQGDQGVIIEQMEGLEALRIAVDLGLRFHLHNNAPGKLLLAWLPQALREERLAEMELVRSTPRTITARDELRRECERIRAAGYATDYAEADEGIHCVAAPVFDLQRHCVAAVWVSAPARRLPKEAFREVGQRVMRTAQEISRRVEAG